MTVLQAIKLSIYTLRTLRSDECAAYIALVRTSDSSARDTDGEISAAPEMVDGRRRRFLMSNPMDDFPFRQPRAANCRLVSEGCRQTIGMSLVEVNARFVAFIFSLAEEGAEAAVASLLSGADSRRAEILPGPT